MSINLDLTMIIDRIIQRRPSFMPLFYPRLKIALKCQTHLTSLELLTLYRLSAGRANIAEIGSYLGASACAFAAGSKAEKGKSRIFCIDTWNNDAMSDGERDTWTQFVKNTAYFKESIQPIRGWSHEVAERLSSLTRELDLLFVDGDHAYEGVKRDWELYKSFLKRGSVVVFHDIGWAEGVQKVVWEDVSPITTNHEWLPNLWWGSMK